MKRYSLLLLTALLLLGCSNEHAGEKLVSTENEEVDIEDNDYEIDNEKKLGISIEDVISIEQIQKNIDDYSEVKTYDSHDEMKVDVLSYNDVLHFFVYTFKGEHYPSVIVARTNNVPVVNDKAVDVMAGIMSSLDDDVQPFVEVLPGVDEEDYVTIGIVFNEEHDITQLPIFLSDISVNDFFLNDDNVEFFKKTSSRAQYKDLYDRAKLHLEEKNNKGYDSAYDIVEILEPVQEYMGKVEIEYDDFDDVSTIHYSGLKNISDGNYIVPFITTNDNGMSVLVGFERNGWLFADSLHFNIDGERESFGTISPDRDTLGGSRIRESYTKTNLDDDLILAIINGDEVKMRFEGDKGNIDYTLSDKEIEALKVIRAFNGIKNNLSNLLFNFDR